MYLRWCRISSINSMSAVFFQILPGERLCDVCIFLLCGNKYHRFKTKLEAGQPRLENSGKLDFTVQTESIYAPATCWKMSRKLLSDIAHATKSRMGCAGPHVPFHLHTVTWTEQSKISMFEKEMQFEALNLHWAISALQYHSSWLQALRPLHGVHWSIVSCSWYRIRCW